jgi:hypothetical protein
MTKLAIIIFYKDETKLILENGEILSMAPKHLDGEPMTVMELHESFFVGDIEVYNEPD